MKEKTPFLIEVNLDDYAKINTLSDLIFIKLMPTINSEEIIDKGLTRLVRYIYDDFGRCIENIIYERTFDFQFEMENEDSMMYKYNSTVYHSYLQDQPYPFRSKHGTFWVANKYNKDNRLIQSVTSDGSTLQQKFKDGALLEKRFRIQTDKLREYLYTFEPLDDRHFVEYEDSEGNYWNVDLGYDCPFEPPVLVRNKLIGDNDFL